MVGTKLEKLSFRLESITLPRLVLILLKDKSFRLNRIIHISTARSWRGGEQQLWYLAGELSAMGFPQVVFCPDHAPLSQRETVTGLSIEPDAMSNALASAQRLKILCMQSPDTIMHAHDARAHTIAILSCVFFRNPAPVVVSRRVDFRPGNGWFSRFKYRHRSVKKIICVSGRIQAIMSEYLGSGEKLVTVHSGIDLSRFPSGGKHDRLAREFGLHGDSKLIGNVSALADHKDYFTFLDTAEILLKQNSGLRFFIIGDGPLRNRIRDSIRSRGLQDVVIMTGHREDIPVILPCLDVFLMTSRTEGLGTTLLDAFACRVPVVSTDAGGIPEVVQDGVTGLLAPVADPVRLAGQVSRLLIDQGLREKLAGNAFLAVQRLTKQETAIRTAGIYREIIRPD